VAERQWVILVILATQEVEIRGIMVQSQPRQIVCQTLSRKHPSQKRADGMAHGVGRVQTPALKKKKEGMYG
jgi:hypothetical protein